MAYTADELLKLDLSTRRDEHPRCKTCLTELSENLTGQHACEDGPRCSDCYFDELGNIIEQHGVGLPFVRR